ncbi:hypothetical protein [Legionella israelensis]|uniref:Uncharacterized protein n=1 Tax=Legionella israelensis TaxID=454 RepID=A0A0W0WNT7_9GAMM|nr:hypothetical protein [Legionella israelensis]KTD33981.1 hypothetical protein Lisr_0159 [Legionella israelensis]QBS10683.1 hypothetical protein E4T55_13020 [Legionella israelensis]SCX83769.1 hypothetical protein SAMN02746069_00381 [Legionella israelensis DSM 19235]STX57639.1 Uncharacterised protein [Legionella israelensis]
MNSIVQEASLIFPFKGNRDYVQGSDMVNAILNHFASSQLQHIKMSVHGFLRNPSCLLNIYDIAPTFLGTLRGSFYIAGKHQWFEIMEQKECPAHYERYEFNEDIITSQCEIQDKQIFYRSVSPYSFMETIVSMKKYLLSILFPLTKVKWLFTGVELQSNVVAQENLSVEITHNLHNKLIKSKIYADNHVLGFIYFSSVAL